MAANTHPLPVLISNETSIWQTAADMLLAGCRVHDEINQRLKKARTSVRSL